MQNTYINDNSTEFYPFLPSNGLPFPNSCIVGMGISIYDSGAGLSLSGVFASGVEIAKDHVAVNIVDAVGTHILDIRAIRDGRAGTAHIVTDGYEAYGWLFPGVIPESTATGTYAGNFPIDPSCVNILDASAMGLGKTLVVNYLKHAMPRRLNLRFAGYLKTDRSLIVSPDNASYVTGVVANVSAEVPEDAVLSVQYSVDNYSMITKLQGHSVITSHNTHGKLKINAGTGIYLYVQNAMYMSDMENDSYPEYTDNDPIEPSNARSRFWKGLNDDHGDSTVLTIIGDHSVPNCYDANKDEASIEQDNLM